MLDLAVSNDLLQYREDQKALGVPLHIIMQLRSYKLEYGQSLIESNDVCPQIFYDDLDDAETAPIPPKNASTPIPSKERRRQGAVHLPNITGGIQNRCRFEKCTKKTSVMCTKCNIYLCLTAARNCFMKFHTQ